MKDFARLNAIGLSLGIVKPTIQANNFELKPFLLQMAQQNQFGSFFSKDPIIHISIFLEACDTLKLMVFLLMPLVEVVLFLTKGQGKIIVARLANRIYHHLGPTDSGFPG